MEKYISFFQSDCRVKFLNYSSQEIENDHSFIQWIFPTMRPSNYNFNAPVLTYEEIQILKQKDEIKYYLELCGYKFCKYWGIFPFNVNRIEILNGHNGLRFSRFIECMILFDIKIFITIIKDVLPKIVSDPQIRYLEVTYEGVKMSVWEMRYYETLENIKRIK